MSVAGPEREWFEKADQDIEMARRALEGGEPLPSNACYAAHQCAEKDLKGYLVAHSVKFSYSHDLVYLTQLCIEFEKAFEELMPTVEILNEYGTALRYPMDNSEEPDIETAKEAIRLAKQVAEYVRKRCPT